MQRWMVIGFCMLAMMLRLWLSVSKELSFDEYYTITLGLGIENVQSHFSSASVVTAEAWVRLFHQLKQWANLTYFAGYLQDLNPPAYFVGMGPWMLLSPLENVWLRLPSVLVGCISIGLMYRLGARFLSRDMAGFTAFIMGVSSIHLFYSSLARPYGVLLMLTLLATELLLSKRWKWYTLVVFCGVFTHLFFLWVILAQGVYLLFTQENRAAVLRRWMFALLIPMLGLMIWAACVFSAQLSNHQGNAIFTPLPFFKLLWHHSVLSRWIFYCDKPLPRWPEYALDLMMSAGLWLLLLGEIYRIKVKKVGCWFQSQTRPWLVLGLCWFFLPLVLLTILDVALQTRLSGTERYLYILSPGLLMMIAAIVSGYSIRTRQCMMGLLAVFILFNTGLFLQQRGLPTENFQGLAERMLPELQPDDLILVMTGYPSLPALGQYLPAQTVMVSVGDFSAMDSKIQASRIVQHSQGRTTIWLIATYGQLPSLQPIQAVIATLQQQGFQLTQTLEMRNIRLGGYRLSRR